MEEECFDLDDLDLLLLDLEMGLTMTDDLCIPLPVVFLVSSG